MSITEAWVWEFKVISFDVLSVTHKTHEHQKILHLSPMVFLFCVYVANFHIFNPFIIHFSQATIYRQRYEVSEFLFHFHHRIIRWKFDVTKRDEIFFHFIYFFFTFSFVSKNNKIINYNKNTSKLNILYIPTKQILFHCADLTCAP